MAFGLHFREDVLDLALGTDDESGANDAHNFFPVHVFFLKDTERVGYFFVGIGEQGKGETKLILKFFLSFGCVGRDAE